MSYIGRGLEERVRVTYIPSDHTLKYNASPY